MAGLSREHKDKLEKIFKYILKRKRDVRVLYHEPALDQEEAANYLKYCFDKVFDKTQVLALHCKIEEKEEKPQWLVLSSIFRALLEENEKHKLGLKPEVLEKCIKPNASIWTQNETLIDIIDKLPENLEKIVMIVEKPKESKEWVQQISDWMSVRQGFMEALMQQEGNCFFLLMTGHELFSSGGGTSYLHSLHIGEPISASKWKYD